MEITVYQGKTSFRVVQGAHLPHVGSNRERVAVYPDASLAWASEKGNHAIQRTIARIAGDELNKNVVLPEVKKVAIKLPKKKV